jgi:hypothetical protein
MRNSAAILRSCLFFTLVACASNPPPEATAPAPAAEPAPPAPPPPAPETAPAAPAPAPEAPAAAPAENASPAPKAPAARASAAKESPSGAAGPNDCKLAIKGDSPVAKACREGGVKQAKAVMKDLVKRAKDSGAKFRCDDCHKDPQDFTKLAADAKTRFKELLAAAK